LLPKVNVAAVAIELYLKSLSSESIYTPTELMPDVYLVTAKPEQFGHVLIEQFEKIHIGLQRSITSQFTEMFPENKKRFPEVLKALEGAFKASRYSFEKGCDITKYSLIDLDKVCTFLHEYTYSLEIQELIT
jgi:hypothetical protein